jgi:hypothetical protein
MLFAYQIESSRTTFTLEAVDPVAKLILSVYGVGYKFEPES